MNQVTDEEIKTQVSRFVGFAIQGVKKKWKNMSSQGNDCNDETVDCVESAVLGYVNDMYVPRQLETLGIWRIVILRCCICAIVDTSNWSLRRILNGGNV